MHLIYEALKKTGGKTDGDALIAAAKGMKWESPRGPISIDPGDARHRPDRLHPPRREGRRQARQRRVRQDRERQGSGEGADEDELTRQRSAHAREAGIQTDLVPTVRGDERSERSVRPHHRGHRMIGPVIGVLFDGFAYGMLLFLLSVGLSVTLGMMNFVNLAHCSVRDARRLCHRDADEQPALAVLRDAALRVPRRRAASASCSSACSTAGSIARAISTSAAHHRARIRVGRGRGLHLRHDPAAGADAVLSARLGDRVGGLTFGVYRLFLVGVSLVITRRCWSPRSNTPASARRCAPRSTTSAWRAGSASMSTARSRSPSRSAAGSPGLGGALAIEIVGLDPSFALHLSDLCADRRRRSAGSARSAARSPPRRCSASATSPANITFRSLARS